jgi:hypothetical protein
MRNAFALALAGALTLLGCNARDRGDDPEPDLAAPYVPRGDGGGVRRDAQLTGKVLAPEGTIPISGALVYVTAALPPPIPDGVFCDKCVHLPEGTPFTSTNPDGTFTLGADPGAFYLVVQKGTFRRVRPLTIAAGPQEVPRALTTMPAITDKAALDDVPKIAVLLGAWDPIELVLARMGLKATITRDLLGKARVRGQDAPAFAIYGVHGLGENSPHPPPLTLITDPKEMGKYHIVFLPCSGGTNFDGGPGPVCTGIFNSDPRVRQTITEFVKQGGRIYSSDWSYEYVRQLFPGFVSFRGESPAVGSACNSGGGEERVSGQDPDLEAWFTAQGKRLDSVKDAWTAMSRVNTQMGLDADGKPRNITPKVWVESGAAPVTASFQHGCGRVLYTTYHTQPTSETNKPLEEQALALLYLILEVGVCVDPPVIG